MNLNMFEMSSIIEFKEVESTNQKAFEYLKKTNEENVLLLSSMQTNGRGRFNRRWESPEGGLYFSLILKPSAPQEDYPLIPLFSSLAVAETINDLGIPSAIKWPNDVLINGKKIAGILIESQKKESEFCVIVGIGVNLNTRLSQYSVELRKTLTTLLELQGQEIDRTDFLVKLLKHFYKYYTLFQRAEYAKITKQWLTYSDTIGRNVKILAAREEIIGTAVDIDNIGFLLVETESGEKKKITSGDCLYIDFL